MQNTDLKNEWAILQNQFDSYEKYSLIIKLVAIIILAVSGILYHANAIVFFLLLVLWFQDAIWKTFQSRIEVRLLQLERGLSNGDGIESTEDQEINAYQYNLLYVKNRPKNSELIKEYLTQAVRPTVAFPHVILLVLALIF